MKFSCGTAHKDGCSARGFGEFIFNVHVNAAADVDDYFDYDASREWDRVGWDAGDPLIASCESQRHNF